MSDAMPGMRLGEAFGVSCQLLGFLLGRLYRVRRDDCKPQVQTVGVEAGIDGGGWG